MEFFFTTNIDRETALLDEHEAAHCTRVLRKRPGDVINFTDGAGTLYTAEIAGPVGRELMLKIIDFYHNYSPRPYYLHMAVAPVKNPDRYEWFLEKATETGVDEITPILGVHSAKRSFNHKRGEKILLSAMKQSLKARLPQLNPLTETLLFLESFANRDDIVKLIGHCREGEKTALPALLKERCKDVTNKEERVKILILIGPEGDFSSEEIDFARECGFTAIHMGSSRFRTESAALTAVTAVYLNFLT